MEPPSITEEDCNQILQKYSAGSKLITFTLKSLAEEVEGYLSAHYKLKIAYQTPSTEEKIHTFFVKKVNSGFGFLTKLAEDFNAFTKELFFYKFCPKLENMNNFVQFAPKFYLCKENFIVIENLSEDGFAVSEKNITFNLEECKIALAILAKFHGSFLAYEENQTRDLGRKFELGLEYPEELNDFTKNCDKNSAVQKWLTASNELILALIDILPNNLIYKDEFKKLLLEESAEKNERYFAKYRKCVLHCDLWTKNFMFQRKENEILDCKLVDFQLLNYFLPGYDLGQFINANTSSEFRHTYKSTLLQTYYKSLESTLQSFGFQLSEIIPLSDFLDGYILCEPNAKIFAFNDSAVLRLPEEILAHVFENVDLLEEFLIDKRVNLIIDLYKSDAEFKNWVDSEMRDLFECLVVKKEFVNKHF